MNRQRTELDGEWQFLPDPNQNLSLNEVSGNEDARNDSGPGTVAGPVR